MAPFKILQLAPIGRPYLEYSSLLVTVYSFRGVCRTICFSRVQQVCSPERFAVPVAVKRRGSGLSYLAVSASGFLRAVMRGLLTGGSDAAGRSSAARSRGRHLESRRRVSAVSPPAASLVSCCCDGFPPWSSSGRQCILALPWRIVGPVLSYPPSVKRDGFGLRRTARA